MMGTDQLPLWTEETTDRRCLPGTLEVCWEDQQRALPLEEVAIQAQVVDGIAGVQMRQRFSNPYPETLEAVYIFPLAGGAAVRQFEMKVGERVISGQVEERGQARRQYEEAIEQGKRAALMEQERDDVFTLKVGNIPPQEHIEVTIHYSEPLPFFENGTTELRLPLVVAPRYMGGTELEREPVGPGVESDTDQVADASRLTPPRLAPGFDPKIHLQIEVDILGSELADLTCSQHAVRLALGTDKFGVRLSKENELLNRDFVLRWRLAGDALQSRLVFDASNTDSTYGMLTLLPPKQDVVLSAPRDVVFILDRSGSMEGNKMGSAARACGLLLDTLGPRDRYAILAFDDQMEWFESEQQPFFFADLKGQEKGQRYLRKVTARGGTELEQAMRCSLQAFAQRSEKERRLPVVVLLTDGQIGGESQVLKLLQKELQDARVFTVGIDTAVNETFLRRLATLGGGTAAFVIPGEQLEGALNAIGREIGQPLLTDIHIETADCGLEQEHLAPQRIPDLFVGRAVNVFFKAAHAGSLTVVGTLPNGEVWSQKITGQTQPVPALTQLWAKTRIRDLEDAFRIYPEQQASLKEQIIQLACTHSLLTRFTAFIAVDHAETVSNKESRQIVQPVSMPDQWEMGADACASLTLAGAMPPMAFAAAMPPSPPMPAPMMRTAAAAPKKQKGRMPGSSGWNKVKSFLGIPEAQETVPGYSAPAGTGKLVSHQDHSALKQSVEALLIWFQQAQQQIEQNQLPDGTLLEQARQALLQQLAQDEWAENLPQLQRFLRREVMEWVAALSAPGLTALHLKPLLQQQATVLAAVRAEGQQVLGMQTYFWEASI